MAVLKGSERSSERLLRVLEEPLPRGETVLGRLDRLRSETGRPVHADLLRLLTHLTYGNEAARQVWNAYQSHRAALSKRLGRDVGARVALFDYLVNVDRRLTNPKIIELADYEKTERSASTDHLTGLFNRAYFDAALKREINRCRRYGQSVSLLMMDLDDFKVINDQHGHPAGDAVLKDVGRLLVQRVRDIDVAARYGGEEFAVLLPETRRLSAFVVAERIRSEIERFFRRRGGNGSGARVTLSGGVAGFPEDADTAETLLARADEALYRAKRSGKNMISVFYREKRRTTRVRTPSRGIRVVLEGERPGQPSSGRVLNISEGGILLETSRRLDLGQSLDLKLLLGGDEEIQLPGQVVRIEEKGEARRRKLFDAGVRFRFNRRSLPAEIARYIRQRAGALSGA